MHEELIAHMRARIREVRKIMSLAHDAEMIGMLQKIVDEAEVDIARLEAEQAGGDPAQ
jgi:hypothetical protein